MLSYYVRLTNIQIIVTMNESLTDLTTIMASLLTKIIHKTLTLSTAFVLAFSVGSIGSLAQEFKPVVIVDMNQLPINGRDDVVTMQSDVLQYLTNQRFTDKDWEGDKIPIDLTIFVMSGNPNSRRYTSRLFFNARVNLSGGVTSPVLKVLDRDWVFTYTLNQQHNYQIMRYDEFSTLIDFYNFIALGLDADNFEQLSGRKYYEQARDLVQLGANRGAPGYALMVQEPGEFTKISLVTELLDRRFEDFRKLMFDYHAEGMDKFAKDKDGARKTIAQILTKMADFKRNKITQRSYLLQLFFDAKQTEICEIFKGTNNTEVLDAMKTLDISNTTVYEQAIKK